MINRGDRARRRPEVVERRLEAAAAAASTGLATYLGFKISTARLCKSSARSRRQTRPQPAPPDDNSMIRPRAEIRRERYISGAAPTWPASVRSGGRGQKYCSTKPRAGWNSSSRLGPTGRRAPHKEAPVACPRRPPNLGPAGCKYSPAELMPTNKWLRVNFSPGAITFTAAETVRPRPAGVISLSGLQSSLWPAIDFARPFVGADPTGGMNFRSAH